MKVFIGYDPRQPIAYQVCAQSVWERASRINGLREEPISITRLDLRLLPIRRMGLTEFTYSRFLVPYLSGFEGHSLFLDSDILVRADVRDIFIDAAQHGDAPVAIVKGPRKFEWASVMLFNNAKCQHLTPEFIDNPANKLYDWAWCDSPDTLEKEWNHLVGYDPPNPDAKIVHYTMGIPVWPETRNCEFAEEWHATHRRMNSTVSFQALMGRSVHVPHIAALK